MRRLNAQTEGLTLGAVHLVRHPSLHHRSLVPIRLLSVPSVAQVAASAAYMHEMFWTCQILNVCRV